MALMDDLVRSASKSIAKDIITHDPVTDDMCIPIRSERGMTAWKFSFNDKVVWIPSGSIKGITEYGCLFKLLNTILIDYAAEYEVYDDKTGITAVALGISDSIAFSDNTSCIEQNLDSVKFGTTQVESKKTKTIGIFFQGALSSVIDDRKYEKVYNLVKGSLADVASYMLFAMMNYTNKTSNYLAETVNICGEYALIRFKRVPGHVDRGPVEIQVPEEMTQKQQQ